MCIAGPFADVNQICQLISESRKAFPSDYHSWQLGQWSSSSGMHKQCLQHG
jgi:hypothetical protein